MTAYHAPLEDLRFVLDQVVDMAGIAELPGYQEATPDLVAAVLEEAGKMAGELLGPLNHPGDRQGAVYENGVVRTPDGFRDAYRQYVESGWNALPFQPDYGGQGLPWTLAMALQEIWDAANMGFALCPILNQGAVELLQAHASEAQKARYLPKMVSGEWTGTMNLTEPQAGSDVGALRARAEPAGDHYLITGQKIFITYGEHDFTDNIIHLVLARTPDAPAGTRGISLFIVPKVLVNDDGSPGPRNDLRCVSIEHKLGINASPTAVMAYGDGEGAVGFLIGEECQGMAAMFTMMNNARLAVGVQGVAIAERAYQQALAYARERRQGRAIGAPETATTAAIIQHPDLRRLLMTMKAKTEAARALAYLAAASLDRASAAPDSAERLAANTRFALLTPLTKAWCTAVGCEVADLGIQVHGGMGFIEETGAAQHFRDARIAPIYEGTNGIQAIDLVTRKLPLGEGRVVRAHIASLRDIIAGTGASNVTEFGDTAVCLEAAVTALDEATSYLLGKLGHDVTAVLAGASAYTRLFGMTSGAVYLAGGAVKQSRCDAPGAERATALARYYAQNHAVEAPGLARAIVTGGGWASSDAADALTGVLFTEGE